MSYHSFLLCFHPGHTDVYINGLPVGLIREGKFEIHTYVNAAGNRVPVELRSYVGCPYKTPGELAAAIQAALAPMLTT